MTRRAVRTLKRLIVIAVELAAAIVLIIASILLVGAFRDRRFPDLETWQSTPIEGEFRARDADNGFTFADYLRKEDQLFQSLGAYMIEPDELGDRSRVLRYVNGGPNNPATFSPNWNRTTELMPDSGEIKGGVLLLHGLSDSPYSMRSLATMFQSEGFYALCLRVPGHGTVPAALLDVSWQDWLEAVRLAFAHVREKVGEGKPIFICGYSNGGALAMLYTLEAANRGDRVPDRVFLFSPAVAVTAFAVASNWHELYSWMPYFEKSKWLSVEPEYDPFKYCSFTKNAGAQVYDVTTRVQTELDRAIADGRYQKIPPIMTFQSAMDATISPGDVIHMLYDRIPANGSELIVFDVNRAALLDGFYRDPHTPMASLSLPVSRNFAVTLVQNADPHSLEVVARTKPASSTEFSVEPLGVTWPVDVYSLAHVAIPFPPDDPMYGRSEKPGLVDGHVPLGDLSLRGEKNVLVISAADMLRLRHNPFHAYMLERIRRTLHRPAKS